MFLRVEADYDVQSRRICRGTSFGIQDLKFQLYCALGGYRQFLCMGGWIDDAFFSDGLECMIRENGTFANVFQPFGLVYLVLVGVPTKGS